MTPLINTIKHLLLSKDVNNIILASELARTCPAIIDITYFNYDNITIIKRSRRSAGSWGDGIMMGNGNGNGTGHSHKYGDGEGSGYGNNE
jgi:hypothetical protein